MKDHRNDFVQFYFSILMNSKEISTELKEKQTISTINVQNLERNKNLNVDGYYSNDNHNSQASHDLFKQPPESTTSEDIKTEIKIDNSLGYSKIIPHKVPKSFICAFEGCGKRFDYKWILDRHINSHFCFKLHKCDYLGCEKAYKSKENLNLHIRNKHLGEKPYQCRYCISRFSHRNGILFN
jgi:uncharacterized Zn-finger protein